ncbi:glycosyltransferase family 4 protein [Thermophagus sp. OGC60D27]|uniref:glycosyltransferase family 4 protein n=1 Tax=Thermophagus sp. OGC60D27 TaxID=3458415 RepID=UPI0040380641
MNKKPLVAILSSGLEKRKDRGYEQSSYKLFQNILNDKTFGCDVELYKGTGNKKYKEFVIRSFAQYRWVKKLGDIVFNDSYVFEYIIFGLFFIFYSGIKRKKFDIIYTQEPRVSKTLYQLKFLLRGKPKIVFAMGVKMTPEHYVNICDRSQVVNIEHYQKAINQYPNLKKFFLIANPGSETTIYKGPLSKSEIRQKYGISSKYVLLSVGAINKEIKRMDYIIDEFENISNDWTLVLVGNPQDKNLIDTAYQKYGSRFKHFFVSPQDIPEFYAMADLFVLASVVEGFPNVLLQAIANGTPVIMHKRELHKWALQNDKFLIDMTRKNELASYINQLDIDKLKIQSEQVRNLYEDKFTWNAQKKEYQKLLLKWD